MSTDKRSDSHRITRLRDVAGGPKDLLAVVAVGGVLVADYWAVTAFRLVHEADPPSLIFGAVVGLLFFELMRRRRKTLFPWGDHSLLLLWGSVISLAAVAGFSGTAAFYAANGGLDRAPAVEVALVVVAKSAYRGDFGIHVSPVDASTPDRLQMRFLTVAELDYDQLKPGSIVVATIRRGYFGRSWYQGYHIQRGDVGPEARQFK